jgi:signal recognition particle GTPase
METAKETITEEQALETTKKIMSGKFSLKECTSRWRC